MSDSASSLPIRTQSNGDAAVKIVDGTITSQALAVDSAGRLTTKMQDGAGNAVTSQVNGAQRALDVGIDVAGVQIDPRLAEGAVTTAAPTYTTGTNQQLSLTTAGELRITGNTVITSGTLTANQGTANTIANAWPVKPTDGTNSQAYLATGEAKVSVTQPLPTGTNTIGSVNQGTSPWVTKDLSDGPVTPGTAAANSLLAGMVANSAAASATAGQQLALQSDLAGNLKVNLETAIPAGANLIGAVNLDLAGSPVSATNPVPVVLSAGVSGTIVNNYNTAAAVAAGATSNHTYTITTSKSFQGKKIHAAASGKMKIEVEISPDGTAFSTLFVAFNSTATPNIDIDMDQILFLEAAGTGAAIRIVRTNLEPVFAQDLYSTISGVEV